jgi:hypothetical protein
MSLEIRVAIHFLWLKNHLNVEISRKVDSIYRELVIGFRDIQKSTHCFEESEHNLEDEPKLDCPRSTEHADAICVLLTDDPCLSQNGLFAFWAFTRVQLNVFFTKISRCGKSISSERWSKVGKASTLDRVPGIPGIPGIPRIKIGMSTYEYIYTGRNKDSLIRSAILKMGGCGYCKVNSCSTVYRNEKDNDLGLFLAFWN